MMPPMPTSVRTMVQTSATVSPVERFGRPTIRTSFTFGLAAIVVLFWSAGCWEVFSCVLIADGWATFFFGWAFCCAASVAFWLAGAGRGAHTRQAANAARTANPIFMSIILYHANTY